MTANGQERQYPIDVEPGTSSSLLLTDGPDGLTVQAVPDAVSPQMWLDPPTLALPDGPVMSPAPDPLHKTVRGELNQWWGVYAFAVVLALGLIATAIRKRRFP